MTGQDWNRLDWIRLAAYVGRYRRQAGYETPKALADKAAGVLSYKTILRVEGAERPVSRETLGILEQYLRWKPGSATAVLRGDEPTLEDEAGEAGVAAALGELLALPAAELDRIHALVQVVSGREVADAWLRRARELRKPAAAS